MAYKSDRLANCILSSLCLGMNSILFKLDKISHAFLHARDFRYRSRLRLEMDPIRNNWYIIARIELPNISDRKNVKRKVIGLPTTSRSCFSER